MSFALTLTPLFTGAGASQSNRWQAISFFNAAIFTCPATNPKYALSDGTFLDLPGLTPNQPYDGCSAFASHVLLWKGSTLQWSDIGDYTTWIPIGQSAGVLDIMPSDVGGGFVQPASGQTSAIFFAQEPLTGLVEGQFVRLDAPPNYNFYTIDTIYPAIGDGTTAETINLIDGIASGFDQTIPANSTVRIYTDAFHNFQVGGYAAIQGSNIPLLITDLAVNNPSDNFLTNGTGPGNFPLPTTTQAEPYILSNTQTWSVGDTVNLSYQTQDGTRNHFGTYLMIVQSIDQSNNSAAFLALGIGSLFNSHQTVTNPGDQVSYQNWVELQNTSSSSIDVPIGAQIQELYGVSLDDQGLTGRSPNGTVFGSTFSINSMAANESGTTVNAGDKINGPILNFVELGTYGYILKSRSLQSVQYVGLSSGTFQIQTVVTEEGLIGRYAFIVVGGGLSIWGETLIILGHRELYRYIGGSVLSPICQGYTKQLYKELDRSRVDEIFMFHREQENEVHIVYPMAGVAGSPNRVLIYNYIENSATIDDYDSNLGGVCSGNAVNWNESLRYIDLTGTYQSLAGSYQDLANNGNAERVNVIAFAAAQPVGSEVGILPRIAIQGRVFNRKGQSYLCTAESADFDFGSPMVWKYGNTLQIYLEIKHLYNDDLQTDPGRPCRLSFQFAGRDNLDSVIRYTDPTNIEVSGNGNFVTQVTLRCSGRYLRFKVSSNQADIQWRISGYNLVARIGNKY